LQEGKSIIRFGDGEINLLLDLKNHYHAFSPRLKSMMKEIVVSYSQKSSYILSVPIFINYSNKKLKEIGKFNVWLPFKVMFFLIFPKKVSYMDAHNFYYNQYFENVIAPVFKDKIVVYITRKETIESLKNNSRIPWSRCIFIEAPEHNALKEYENIKHNIDIELSDVSPKDIVLFFAMGPAGKYIIFEYSRIGYQCLDLGRGVEVMFTEKSLQHLI
jgi:hypothetical protein